MNRTPRGHLLLHPLTRKSDQARISPYTININTVSSIQVSRIKKKTQLGNFKLIQYQILQTDIISILWQTVRRIANEILGVKGLNAFVFFFLCPGNNLRIIKKKRFLLEGICSYFASRNSIFVAFSTCNWI